jgi:hypothetical protein
MLAGVGTIGNAEKAGYPNGNVVGDRIERLPDLGNIFVRIGAE